MAWSDAARKAAAMARRSHAKGRKVVPGYGAFRDFKVSRHAYAKALVASRKVTTSNSVKARNMGAHVGANIHLAVRRGILKLRHKP